MTIDEADTIDFAGVDPDSGRMMLILLDHLSWDDSAPDHLPRLQEKLNAYLAYIETGQIYEQKPEAKGLPIDIKVFGAEAPSQEAEKFYRLYADFVGNMASELGMEIEMSFQILSGDD